MCVCVCVCVGGGPLNPVLSMQTVFVMMMAHSSQTRILGKVDGQFE